MTGSVPIYSDESYPRASELDDAEQTDASVSTTNGVTDTGATIASEGSSEDSDMLATDG
jgi:hypothetical protein